MRLKARLEKIEKSLDPNVCAACGNPYLRPDLLTREDAEQARASATKLAQIEGLTPAQCEDLIAGGIATGGMLAKLNAATSALRQSVGQVRIANGSTPDVLARLLDGEALGTTLAEG